MSEARASVLSFIEKNAKSECSVPIQAIVDHAITHLHVSETLARAALDDLVAFGLVEVLPEGAILTPLSERLTKEQTRR